MKASFCRRTYTLKPDILGPLCRGWILGRRVLSIRGGIIVAARWPSDRDFGGHARQLFGLSLFALPPSRLQCVSLRALDISGEDGHTPPDAPAWRWYFPSGSGSG